MALFCMATNPPQSLECTERRYPFAALAGITMVITYYATRSIGNIYLLFTAKVVVAAILYTLLMWGSNSVVFKESIQFLKKKK